jgi:hypothetical protein
VLITLLLGRTVYTAKGNYGSGDLTSFDGPAVAVITAFTSTLLTLSHFLSPL